MTRLNRSSASSSSPFVRWIRPSVQYAIKSSGSSSIALRPEAAASSNLPPDEIGQRHRRVGFGQVAVVHQRLEAQFVRLVAVALLAREPLEHLAVRARAARVGSGIARVELDGFLEELDRVFDAALGQTIQVVLSAQAQVVGLDVARLPLRERDLLREAELELQRLDDLARDLLLDVEDVVELALVRIAPDLAVGLDVHELDRDSHRVLEPAHAAAHDVARAELAPDGLGILLRALELHRRPARHEFDLVDHRQARDQFLGEAVAEVIGFLVGADVVERQHGERARLDLGFARLASVRTRHGTARVRTRGRLDARYADRDADALERSQDGLQVLVRVAVVVLDVLDAGERVLETRRNLRRLEVHRQDAPLALAGQHDFLGHVVRADRRLRDHQQQDLGVVQRVDDLLAPHPRRRRCRRRPSTAARQPRGVSRSARGPFPCPRASS